MELQHVRWTDFLSQELPKSYKDELHLIISNAYSEAYSMGRRESHGEMPEPILLGPLENERLADTQGLSVQSHLHSWASQHPELIADFGANKRKRQHVQVRTKRALLTAHRVLDPKSFPPSAIYRGSNAQRNHLWLPFLKGDNSATNEAYLYLLHGPSLSDNSQLGFVRLAIPSPDEQSYIATLDIYKHSDFDISTNVEEIEDNVFISLKVQKDAKKQSS